MNQGSDRPERSLDVAMGPVSARHLGIWSVVGCGAVLAIWAAVASRQPTVIVASPGETIDRLGELGAATVAEELWRTGWRALRGTAVGFVVGVALGVTTGRSAVADALLRPTRAVLAGSPPIIAVVLVAIWVGLDGDPTPWVVGLAVVPLVWIATHEAVRSVDPELLEMAAGLHVGRRWTLRHVTLPAIAPALRSSGAYATATAYRITIMAELFVSPDGIGARIARARTSLDTAEVFAWALVAIIAALAFEALSLRVGRPSTPRLGVSIRSPSIG
ncbi:MAG: ABC transporter permease subunit [Actinomycetota bacterium]